MFRAVVIANGCLNQPFALRPDDFLIAADGGARHCLALGIRPRMVIGDLDSLQEAELAQLKDDGVEIIQYPRRKDYTDLELALRYVQNLEVEEVLILGALGERWDQTIANILLPASLPSLRIHIIDRNQEIFFLSSGDQLELHGRPGDTVSLIPLAGKAQGVTTQNLEYPLHLEDLQLGSTLGISNALLSERGSVSLQTGLMLCVVIHENSG